MKKRKNDYWIKKVEGGYEVYKTGITHSERVAQIGWTGFAGLRKAVNEIRRRMNSDFRPTHVTKKGFGGLLKAGIKVEIHTVQSDNVFVMDEDGNGWQGKSQDLDHSRVIIFASTKKESKEIAIRDYPYHKFRKPYRYTAGKGNNFYEYSL